MLSSNIWCFVCVFLAMAVKLILCLHTVPIKNYESFDDNMEDQPEDVLIDLITRYGQTIMRARDDLENSKRTVDFGLSRGYSGAQEAKHRMAMAVANFAGGPGRKRRVENRFVQD
ncbi:diuretic hormone class 2 [Malaya genurostris]|uniref:diuretic hormone class 2 n=1 Tax=Malaya genurostris TaxID=325434 RepID=UPI0026F3F96F|nr:diuretic hormone class 2 [Malaya genurostris]